MDKNENNSMELDLEDLEQVSGGVSNLLGNDKLIRGRVNDIQNIGAAAKVGATIISAQGATIGSVGGKLTSTGVRRKDS